MKMYAPKTKLAANTAVMAAYTEFPEYDFSIYGRLIYLN